MAIYQEYIIDKKTGKKTEKLIDGKKVYYIRTYVSDKCGNRKQITRHNKDWIGRDGYWSAQQEENRLQYQKYNQYDNITMNELFEMYLKDIKLYLKPSSIRKNCDDYQLHIKPFLGNIKVFELSNKNILDFHEYLNNKKNKIESEHSKRKIDEYELSISFKKAIHITLSSILNYACKYIGLNKNVASIVGNFKTPKGSLKKEMNYLTHKEFNDFIKFETNETYSDFFTLLFYTGMRRGELLALTIDDIDFKKKTLSINKSINPKNGLNSTDPKTNKSNRKIKMLDIVYFTLSKYINKKDSVIFGLKKIKPTTLQRKCDNNCKKANINKNIRIHDFRHSFASMCIFKGIKIEIISEYLGHENISTTLNTYAHLYPNSQDELVNILNKQD